MKIISVPLVYDAYGDYYTGDAAEIVPFRQAGVVCAEFVHLLVGERKKVTAYASPERPNCSSISIQKPCPTWSWVRNGYSSDGVVVNGENTTLYINAMSMLDRFFPDEKLVYVWFEPR